MAPWMIGAPIALVGAVLLWLGLHFLGQDYEMRSWPRADGVIISSTDQSTPVHSQDKWGDWKDYKSYSPVIRYKYTVDPNTSSRQEFESTRITRLPFATDNPKRWTDRYPVGKAVKVYYDPKDPKSSVLEVSISVPAVLFLALGGLCLLVGLGITVVPLFLKK